jgi:hypothetical protein
MEARAGLLRTPGRLQAMDATKKSFAGQDEQKRASKEVCAGGGHGSWGAAFGCMRLTWPGRCVWLCAWEQRQGLPPRRLVRPCRARRCRMLPSPAGALPTLACWGCRCSSCMINGWQRSSGSRTSRSKSGWRKGVHGRPCCRSRGAWDGRCLCLGWGVHAGSGEGPLTPAPPCCGCCCRRLREHRD